MTTKPRRCPECGTVLPAEIATPQPLTARLFGLTVGQRLILHILGFFAVCGAGIGLGVRIARVIGGF